MTAAAAADAPTDLSVSCVKAFMPGDLIEGKYRLEGVLGEGAMGRVWLARNVMLDLPLAIKIVQPELHGREAMARLLTEARALAQLRHPNIVRVFDYHQLDNCAYAVMELLEGCTLADLMDQGPLPAQLAVRLMLPILAGLAATHRAGIVHRDIKPQNVFITRAGDRICPKLLDFGIARLAGSDEATPPPSAAGGDVSSETRARRSAKRLIIGSPGYMSPEQAWGEADVDARTDLWAVAVVLYEAISGKNAFAANSYREFLRALAENDLAPLRGRECAKLWAILSRALVKSPVDRIASTTEFAALLAAWMKESGVDEDLSGDSLPACWMPAGGLVARALARTADATLASLPSGLPQSVFETLCDIEGARRIVVAERGAPEQSGIRTIATRRHSHERALTALTLVASALLGVAVALAHTHASEGKLAAQARAHQAIHASAAQPRAASHKAKRRPVSTETVQVAAASEGAPGEASALAALPSVPTVPREARVHAVAASTSARTRRSASLEPERSEAERRLELRREAAALGLKSPW